MLHDTGGRRVTGQTAQQRADPHAPTAPARHRVFDGAPALRGERAGGERRHW